MATPRAAEMKERISKVEAAIVEFRGKFAAVDARFDAVDRRFDTVDRRFDDLEQRLNSRIDLQVERLEQLVMTTAEGISGVLSSIEREIQQFRAEAREQARQISLILANHEGRLAALEDRPPAS
jgi:chromosome segregation ATPase